MTEPLGVGAAWLAPRELTFVNGPPAPPFIQKINGEDYDVISIAGNFTFSNASPRAASPGRACPDDLRRQRAVTEKTAKDWAGTWSQRTSRMPPRNTEERDEVLDEGPSRRSSATWTRQTWETSWSELPPRDSNGLNHHTVVPGVPGARASRRAAVNFIKAFMHSGAAVQKHGELLAARAVHRRRQKIRERTTHRHRMCTTTASCRAAAATTTTAWALTCSSCGEMIRRATGTRLRPPPLRRQIRHAAVQGGTRKPSSRRPLSPRSRVFMTSAHLMEFALSITGDRIRAF
uniref:Uncharacterized protein n=1 Tax=Macrostomum lignano TaxID=282301 RepID=A0A1I8FN54_9PLAT